MPRYPRYRRRYRRRSGPAYTVTRKLIKAGAFSRLADSQYYAASAKLCLNPSNLTSDRVGSIVTVKHIEVQLANLPTYFGVNEDQQGVLVSLLILCMNLIRMYLGSGIG